MIHLIRKFINTGNKALNLLIEEGNENIKSELDSTIGSTRDTGGSSTAGTVMGKLNALLASWTSARAGYIDTINTNASNMNSRLTSTRAGYLDYLANTTYGLSAIKTLIDKYCNWGATYGTTVTLWTLSSAVSVDRQDEVSTGSFTAPESGTYRIDYSVTVGSNQTSSYSLTVGLGVQAVDLGFYQDKPTSVVGTYSLLGGKEVFSGSAGSVNSAPATKTGNIGVYLHKGARYRVVAKAAANTGNGYYNLKINSATVKYTKTQVTY